jgi:hypothetical protein
MGMRCHWTVVAAVLLTSGACAHVNPVNTASVPPPWPAPSPPEPSAAERQAPAPAAGPTRAKPPVPPLKNDLVPKTPTPPRSSRGS